MKNVFLIFTLVFLLAACGSHPHYSELSLMRLEGARELPYQLATAKKDSQKLLLILKDEPDSLELSGTALEQYFSQRQYHILIAGKPGKTEYQRQLLDQKQARLEDLQALLKHKDSLRSRELIIIGFGEGGYLVPELARLTAADLSFVVNAGPFSKLHEIDQISSKEPEKPALKSTLAAMRVNSVSEFQDKFDQLLNENGNTRIFHNHSNQYYRSYYLQPVLPVFRQLPVAICWLVSKQYPLLSAPSRELLRISTLNKGHLYYKEIPGSGNFRQEEEMRLLLENIDYFIRKQQSY